jgi:hypothetical protein
LKTEEVPSLLHKVKSALSASSILYFIAIGDESSMNGLRQEKPCFWRAKQRWFNRDRRFGPSISYRGENPHFDVDSTKPAPIPSLFGPAGESGPKISSIISTKISFAFSPFRRNETALVCMQSRRYNSKIASLAESSADYFRDHACCAKKSSIVLFAMSGRNHSRTRDIRNSISFTIF